MITMQQQKLKIAWNNEWQKLFQEEKKLRGTLIARMDFRT